MFAALKASGPKVTIIVVFVTGIILFKACQDMKKEEKARKVYNERMRKRMNSW